MNSLMTSRTNIRRQHLIVALAVVTLGGAVACGKATPAAAKTDSTAVVEKPSALTATQRERIHLVKVESTTFNPLLEATGNVAFNGDRSTQVLSPVSGPAIKVLVSPGAVVTRGQPLAMVSSPDFAAAVASYRKANASYRNTKRIADRDSALFKNDALARSDLEQAQNDVIAAEADVEAAIQNMRALGVSEDQISAVKEGRTAHIEAVIRSPIDGTVVEKLIADGQLLQAGSTACFTIANLENMWVITNVYARDVNDVAVGETANVYTDERTTPMAGRVDYVASLVDPGTRAINVRVVTPNPGHLLRKDMFVRVVINSQHRHRGLLVPESSVLRDEQNLPYVFVAEANGAYARHSVTLGSHLPGHYEVLRGLNAGQQVVSEGSLFLQFAESQ